MQPFNTVTGAVIKRQLIKQLPKTILRTNNALNQKPPPRHYAPRPRFAHANNISSAHRLPVRLQRIPSPLLTLDLRCTLQTLLRTG